MTGRLERDIDDWLAAEESGAAGAADEALLRALSAIPRREPGYAFAGRVMRGVATARTVATVWRSRWLRGAVAACLVAAGLALGFLPDMLSVGTAIHLGGAIVAGAWHVISRWLAASFASWDAIEDVASALRSSLANPVAISVLLGNVFVAAASLLGLKRLLGVREETVQW